MNLRTLARETSKATLVASLCCTIAMPEAFASGPPDKPATAAGVPMGKHTAPLTDREKTLHALNRLTFGPRPGDEAVVEKMGLDAWFDRQLHPETIDDSALNSHLAQFPLLQLPQGQLIEDFPGPLRIRAMLMTGREEPPSDDPVVRAVYADYIARYKIGLALQATGAKQGDITAQSFAEAVNGKLADKARELNKPGITATAAPDNGMAGNEMAAGGDNSMGMAAAATPAARSSRKQQRGNEIGSAAYEKAPPATITADGIKAIVQLPPDQRFQAIVALSPSDNIKFSIVTAAYTPALLAGFTPYQREMYGAMQQPLRVVGAETLGGRILRDTFSERQLQAVMDDFWLNHFSVYVKKNQFEPFFLASYERDAILPNSLGNFEKLLIATAESPAMLMYLDNWQSVGPDSAYSAKVTQAKKRSGSAFVQAQSQGINENYARELMELHTVGVNGGYTQKDVIEVAKCFTGWTLNRPYGVSPGGPAAQGFVFDPSRHEGGSKTVLGHVIPEGGMQEGLTVLHILATSPQTAHFISEKIAVRFVADTPPPALVDRMAATFLKSNGDIKAVLSAMFHSPEFFSPAVYRAKVKTPIEFMVSALRASDATVSTPGLLIQAVERLGMPVYGMQTPNGYSWQSADWVSSGALVNRMNFALVLSGDHLRGASTDWATVLGVKDNPTLSSDPSPTIEKQLEFAILGEAASPKTRATVLEQFKSEGLQKKAAKDFALNEQPSGEDQNEMSGDAAPRFRKAKAYLGGGAGLDMDGSQPETPLDTMAGLLLGSPDFQRR